MKKIKTLLHNVLLIKEGETSQLLHFWLIFMITLGVGLAIGRASSDALFLARYGIEYLPVMYIALAPLLALVSIFYAAMVDRLSSESFFKYILTGLIITIFSSWFLMSQTNNTLIYPIYFILHKIASELLLVHGSLYLIHNFNTLQAKRLFPLIFTGEQLGCIIGGLLVSVSTSFIDAVDLPLLWVALMITGIVQLYIWHGRNGASPYFNKQKITGSKVKVAIQSVYQGLKFTRTSSLLRNASFALFFLVIIYYILSYSTNLIFVKSFSDEQDLAKFLGLFTAGASIITLGLQLFVTNRIIERFGIRKLNLVFPLAMASAVIGLIISFTLGMAIFIGVLRDSLLNSLQNPTRILFFNALPSYIQGRAGAVSIAFVMPVALLVCGSLLWVIQKQESVIYFLLPCFMLSIAFLYYSYKMNKTYTNTLTTHLKDRLYLPKDNTYKSGLEFNEETLNSLISTFDKLPQARKITVSLLANYFPEKAVNFIIPRLNDMSPAESDIFIHSLFENKDHLLPYKTFSQFPKKDFHIQATLQKLITDNNYPEAIQEAFKNINSSSLRLKTSAAYTILKNYDHNHTQAISIWLDLLDQSTNSQLSSLALIPLTSSLNSANKEKVFHKLKESIDKLLKHNDIWIVSRTLRQLPANFTLLNKQTINECIQTLSNNADPTLRETASYGLIFLSGVFKYKISYDLLNDSHIAVRTKSLLSLDIINKDNETVINQWLISGASSPRIQSTILSKVINDELLSHNALKEITKNRAYDANNYAIAINLLETDETCLTSADHLLLIVLKERKIQLIDIALQALTPLCAEDQINVIRAGLISDNEQLIANSCEILNNIENQPGSILIEQLLQNKAVTLQEDQKKVEFSDIEDIYDWASTSSDHWVSHIADIMRGATMVKNESINLIERVALLKNTDIFSEVPTDDLIFVAKELEDIKYFNSERVFEINEFGDRMYIIVNGKVGISISPDITSQEFIVTLGSGTTFGEMNILDNLPRSASAHVLEDTYLLTLEKSKLLGLIKSYPDLSLGILRALSFKIRENHSRQNELKKSISK